MWPRDASARERCSAAGTPPSPTRSALTAVRMETCSVGQEPACSTAGQGVEGGVQSSGQSSVYLEAVRCMIVAAVVVAGGEHAAGRERGARCEGRESLNRSYCTVNHPRCAVVHGKQSEAQAGSLFPAHREKCRRASTARYGFDGRTRLMRALVLDHPAGGAIIWCRGGLVGVALVVAGM